MFARTLSLWQRLIRRQPEAFRPDPRSQTEFGNEGKGEDSDGERRIWVRHPSTVETVCLPAQNGDTPRLPAKVQNVSLGGINLLMGQQFETGELISIEMPGADQQTSSKVLAYVVHATRQTSGEWSLGCTFARELTDSDLQALGAKRLKAADSDNRKWARFSCELKASYHFLADAEQEKRPASVLNVSASGVGLLVDNEIEAGTLLNVEMQGTSGQAPLTMLACVVHVSRRDGDWAVGCNFIRELSDRDLQALV